MLNCDSSGILKIILLAKNVLQIIQIAVPILLIVMAMFDVVKLIISAMDKTPQIIKKICNRFLAAVIVFLVPTILNLGLSVLGKSGVQSSDCWINANEEHINALAIQERELEKKEAEAEELAQKLTKKQKDAIALALRKSIQFSHSTQGDRNGGGVLIIAGHARQPECNSCGDCRGPAASGYAEEDETRSLAFSLKKALLEEGVNAVIANQLLIGDENSQSMDASFLCARSGAGSYAAAFEALNNEGYWSTFDHIIEIHFNAANGTAYGTELTTNAGEENKVSNISNQLLNKVSSYTGSNRGAKGYSGGTLGNWNYFVNNLNKDMTYIEVQFYDNASVMATYKGNQEKIAKDMAKIIKAG